MSSLLPPQMVEGVEAEEGEMSKLTNDELKKWIQGKLNAKDKIKHGCWGANDIEAYNQLLALFEEPKDGEEEAQEILNEINQVKDGMGNEEIVEMTLSKNDLLIIRKALIHYGNMPKKAYRYNEKLTREETT